MLNKDEKAQVMLSICDVNSDDVLSPVNVTVSNERHISENSARRDFWACLQSSGKQMMSELLHTLANLFASSDKDKYMKFQLEWHQCCSVFLLPPDKSLAKKNVNLAHTRQRWIGYCEGRPVDKDIRDAVVISVCSAVYNYLLKRVSEVQQLILEPACNFN